MAEKPQSKAVQLANILQQRIRSGEWIEGLPAERKLAEEYLVSRTTLRKALDILHRRSYLSTNESGQRIPAAQEQESPYHEQAAKHVVFLTLSLRGSPALFEQLTILEEILSSEGVRIEFKEAAWLGERKNPKEALQRLIGTYPHAVWILHKMPQLVQAAAQEIDLPALIFGTAFAEITLPSINIDFRAVARHALTRCLRRGYERLAVLIHRTSLAGDELIVNELATELRQRQAPPLSVFKHDFQRQRLLDNLDRRLVSVAERPQVILIVNQHHLLSATSHLLRRGVRIPEDLGLIYLNNDSVAECLSPLPERYDVGDQLARRLAAAVRSQLVGEVPNSTLLVPELLPGESLL